MLKITINCGSERTRNMVRDRMCESLVGYKPFAEDEITIQDSRNPGDIILWIGNEDTAEVDEDMSVSLICTSSNHKSVK